MSAETLLLTPWMIPHKIIPWQTAVTMSFLGKVDVLEEYDDVIRSPSFAIKAPAVVRLRRPIGGMKRGVKFSRINVFARDEFRCQYCGARATGRELTLDHVIPRSRGGKHCWTNVVACCNRCNDRKGRMTPREAGMHLVREPVAPKRSPELKRKLEERKYAIWRTFIN